jgi:hypothetical protein
MDSRGCTGGEQIWRVASYERYVVFHLQEQVNNGTGILISVMKMVHKYE